MKLLFTYLTLLNLTICAYSQHKLVYFSDALSNQLNSYKNNCELALKNQNYDHVTFLFDSLVQHHLKGTTVKNLSLKKLNNSTLQTDSINRPFLLLTTASWQIKTEEEIEAINQLAKIYEDQIDVILLYWDTKMRTKQASKAFSKQVLVTYIDERENRHNSIINTFKHALGYPTSFYISEDKKIVQIDRGGYYSNLSAKKKTLFELNYEHYNTKLVQLILQNTPSDNTTITTRSD